MPRALIYCRASSDPKMKLRSVGDQEQECRGWCAREGWEIVDVIVDANRSATRWATREREGWGRVLEALPSIDVLVMWEASRAARQMEGFVELRSALQGADTLLAYSGRIYDLSRGDDVFTASLDALLAEREASTIRDRIVRTVRMRGEKGRPAGRVPYGYRRRYDPNTGELVDQIIDETTGPIVREIVRRFLAGDSIKSIASDLQARAVLTPGGDDEWKVRTVKRILENRSIAGYRVHRGEILTQDTWPPIISTEDHEQIQSLLSAPRGAGPRGTGPKWLLGHIAKCGQCGYRMESRGRTDRKVYECGSATCTERSSILGSIADAWVNNVVIGFLRTFDPSVLEDDTPDEFSELSAQLEELETRVREAADAYSAGSVGIQALSSVEQKLQPKIARLREKLRPKAADPTIRSILLSKDPAESWQNAPLVVQRGVLSSMFDIRVYRATRRGVFDPNRIKVERI